MKQSNRNWYMYLAATALLSSVGFAQPTTTPTTTPADDPTADFIFGLAKPTTKPTTAPTTGPVSQLTSPLIDASTTKPVDFGKIILSDGTEITGSLGTTDNKPIRVWDESIKQYRDVPLKLIKSAKAHVLWERDEKEWQFKESGSDVKVYSGKSYPARETEYAFELVNGQTFTGSVAAPIYVKTEKGTQRVILHKRDKGEIGQALRDLVYVTGFATNGG